MTPETPIVFLDFDGVLVTHGSLHSAQARRAEEHQDTLARAGKWVPRGPGTADYHRAILHAPAVRELDRICVTAGASVVVSSSWRRAFWPDLRDWLRDVGLSAPVIDHTPMLERPAPGMPRGWTVAERGTEIAAWRESAGHVGPYVVLDDDSDAGVGHEDRFVRCDFDDGLTAAKADEALAALRRAT